MKSSQSLAVLNGEALSEVLDLSEWDYFSILAPSDTLGSSLTFQHAARPGDAFTELVDDAGLAVSWVLSAGKTMVPGSTAIYFAPLKFIKVRMGTSASPTVQPGTAASVVLTTETGKTLTISSAVVGVASNLLSVTVQVNTSDALSVTNPAGTSNILIKLANATASKNAAATIQTAVRALGTVGGVSLAAATVVGNAAYNAAPSIALGAGITLNDQFLTGGSATAITLVATKA